VMEDSRRIRAEAEQFMKQDEIGDIGEFESARVTIPNYETQTYEESDIRLHTTQDTKNKDYYKELGHMKSIILGLSEKLHINMVHRDEVDVLRS
jgi:hypothetical protein